MIFVYEFFGKYFRGFILSDNELKASEALDNSRFRAIRKLLSDASLRGNSALRKWQVLVVMNPVTGWIDDGRRNED